MLLLHPFRGCMRRSNADAGCQLRHSSHTATQCLLLVGQTTCTINSSSQNYYPISVVATQQSPTHSSGCSASERQTHMLDTRRCRNNHIACKAVQSRSHAAASGAAVPRPRLHRRTRGFRTAELKPSLIRRLRRVHQVITLLDIYSDQLTPRLWNTALCHLVDLVHKEQQTLSRRAQRLLQRQLAVLTGTATAKQKQQSKPSMRQDAQHSQLEEEEQQMLREKHQHLQQQKHVHGQTTMHDQQAHQQQQPEAVAGAAASPTATTACTTRLSQFSSTELSIWCWALARLNVRLDAKFDWLPVLDCILAASGNCRPQDLSLLVWSLQRLRPRMPSGWAQQVLDTAVLPTYPMRSLLLLLYGMVRLRAQLPSSCHAAVLMALQPELTRLNSCQLSSLLWSLSLLRVRPSTTFMKAALLASSRHLPETSCADLAALVSAIGRLGFVPRGRWLLALYDQLFWTADQLQLRQLAQLIWALGRLKLGGMVPFELLERLLTFAKAEARRALAEATAPAAHSPGREATTAAIAAAAGRKEATGQVSTAPAAAAVPRSQSIQRRQLSKQLSALLCGLAGLKLQATAEQQEECCEWLAAVVDFSNGSSSGTESSLLTAHITAVASRQLPAVLRAAVLLQLQPSLLQQQRILQRLDQLSGAMSHWGLTVCLWAAVHLGCQPRPQHLQHWLALSEPQLVLAAYGEINMVLAALAGVSQLPSTSWLSAAVARMGVLVSSATGRDLATSLRWLAVLRAGPAVPPGLLVAMQLRMEQLEMAVQASSKTQQSVEACLREIKRQQAVAASQQAAAALAAALEQTMAP